MLALFAVQLLCQQRAALAAGRKRPADYRNCKTSKILR
jgi:hypothetical protein